MGCMARHRYRFCFTRDLLIGNMIFLNNCPCMTRFTSIILQHQAVEDVNVTFEDQKKINTFARNTNRMTEFKDEIEAKKKSLQNLQDASDDLMMAEDDALLVPYQIGDVFISHTQEETQEMLEAAKELLQQEIKDLEGKVSKIQQVLGDLKVQLYAKFGNNINLEADES